MHRPEMYERDRADLQGQAELIIGKQRNGPTGTVKLFFRKAQMRFESVEGR
jgi:replicative DNA helicase